MALNPGDIAFIGINTAGGPDDWLAFVALADIPAGTVIYLSDNELTSSSATSFNTGESYSKWTAPVGGVAAGTVVTLTNFDITGGPVANIGTAAIVTFSGSTNRGFSQTADSVYAYLVASDAAVDTPTTHLARINLGNAEDGSVPATLPADSRISFTSGQEGAVYNGSRTNVNSFADFKALLSNPSNWTLTTGATPISALSTTAFTTTVTATTSVTIAAQDASAAEAGQDPGTFRITRTGDTTNALSVSYTIAGQATNGTDYTPTLTGSTAIAAGQSFVDVTITPVDDSTIEGNETVTLTLVDTANYDLGATTEATVTIADNDPPAATITKIHQIQGNASTQSTGGVHNDVSPLNGQTVTIEGVVVADFQGSGANGLRGFFIQEEIADQDTDAATSEGLFVFTGNTPPLDVQEGQKVRVTGAVSEFFGMTQLTASTAGSISLIDGGNNLAQVQTATIDLSIVGDVDDYYEQFEGMRVQFSDKLVVSEYFELARYGQIVLTAGDRPFQYSHTDNTPTVAEYATFLDTLKRSRIILDDDDNTQNSALPSGVLPYPQPGGLSTGTQGTNYFRGGDSITGLTGVLHWSFAGQSGTDAWRIRPTQANPISFTPENTRPTTAPDVGGNVKVASFNVLNYFTTIDTVGGSNSPRGADSVDEFNRQNEKLMAALQGINADVFGLVEIENNGTAVQELVNRLNAVVGAGTYDYINTGVVGTDAITVAIIYKVGVVAPKGTAAILDAPAFTDPNNTGEQRNRPAIAQTFEVINPSNPDFGAAFNVVVNHLKSKGSGTGAAADQDQNDGQGFSNDTRTKAAAYLANVWIPSDPTGQGDADWLIIGDLNAYKGETPITTLKNAGYTDLVEQFGGPNAYSYVFNGQLGYLDYALANNALKSQVTGVAEWHINADEVPVFDYNNAVDDGAGEQSFEAEPSGNLLYEPNAFRTSDHDPVIIGLDLTTTTNKAPTAVNLVNTTTTLSENTSTASRIKVADITIADDGQGSNNLSLTGADAGFFEIDGNALFVKANTVLDFETKSSYAVTVNVNDPTVGGDPDASTVYTLTLQDQALESVDLSNYVRIGRYTLPEPTRTTPPANSLLAQEVSAVTYNWDTDTLFVIGDGGRSVVQVTKTGQLVNSMTLALGNSPQGTEFYDTEGLTYIGSGKFVLVEERDRQVSLFTYTPGGTLTRSAVQTVKLGTTVGNIGLEGISYDPATTGFIAVKEASPQGIFQTSIDFAAGTATNGSPTTVNSTNLFDPALLNLVDIADVYALSNLPSLNGLNELNNLLVLSQESGKVVEVDRAGNILSSLTITSDPGNPLSVVNQGFEGVTMDRNGLLYLTSEEGGGDVNHPQLWVYAPASFAYTNQAPVDVSIANPTASLAENASTAARIKVGNIIISDDAKGTNNLSLSGADASVFEISGTELFLKAGTTLDFETKTSYAVTVNVDDPTLGANPDATTTFTLAVTDVTEAPSPVIISEVAPWSSGNSNGTVGADWFEITNTSSSAVNITGWRMDDESNSFATAVTLTGITSIAPGESVIFVESSTSNPPATVIQKFKTAWFGSNPPANLQIGTYQGSGVGLGNGGDAVNLFDASGAKITGVTFGTSTAASPFRTFDNAAGLQNTAIATLGTAGVNGAFSTTDGTVQVVGSPGTIFQKTVGTGRRDTLVGTAANDQITGGVGGDILTGGDGFDQFIYTNIRDAGDTITDFEIGKDKIVLAQLLDSLVSGGYSGSNAIADGYIRIVATTGGAMVQLDSNGPAIGGAVFRDFITVQGAGVDTLNNPNNFIF